MIYWFQSLSLKTRFLGVLLLLFPVLGFHWLLESAPWAQVQLVAISGGIGLPDLWWYVPAQLRTHLAAWGDEGKTLYLTVLAPTILGYLLSYAAFLSSATLYLLKKGNPRGPWWYLLPLLPLGSAACDLLENLSLTAVSLWGVTEAWAWLVSVLTAAKWIGLALSGLVLAAGGITTLLRAILARKGPREYTDQ